MENLPKSLTEALEAGSQKYFTGRRCQRGHLSARYTTSANCVACVILARAKYPKEKKQAQQKAWYTKNREQIIAKARAYYAATELSPEQMKAACRRSSEFRKRYPWKHAEIAVATQCRSMGMKMHEKDRPLVQAFYEYAHGLRTLTGENWQVDHIFPLRSDWVCGLHNPFNLRLILGSENLKKGNRRGPIHDLHSLPLEEFT